MSLPTIKSGYAYLYSQLGEVEDVARIPNDMWNIEAVQADDFGHLILIGERMIDDTTCNVWQVSSPDDSEEISETDWCLYVAQSKTA